MSITQKHTDLGGEIQTEIDAVRQAAEDAVATTDALQTDIDKLRTDSQDVFGTLHNEITALKGDMEDLTARVAALESGVVVPPEPTPPPQTIITRTDETGCAGYGVHFAGLIPDEGGFDTAQEREDYCAFVGLIYANSTPGQGVLRVAPQIAAMSPVPPTISTWAVNAMIALGAGTPCIVRAGDPEASQVKVLKTSTGATVGMAGFTGQGPAVLDVRDNATRWLATHCLRRLLASLNKTGLRGVMVDNCTVYPSRVSGLFTAPPADYGTTQAEKDAFDAAWSAGMAEFVQDIEVAVHDAFQSMDTVLVINPGRTALDQQRFKDWAMLLNPDIAFLVEHFDDVTGSAANALIKQCRALPHPLCFVSRHRIQTTAEWQTQSKPWLDLGAFAVIAAGGRMSGTARIPYWVSICPVSLTTRLLSTAYGPLDTMLTKIAGLGEFLSLERTGNLCTYVGQTGRVTLDVNTATATWSA